METGDRFTKKKYFQHFYENMKKVDEPVITKFSGKPYTKITWKTDFDRFGITGFSNDMVALMKRRVYDIAGVTDNKVNVYYNGKKINVRSSNCFLISGFIKTKFDPKKHYTINSINPKKEDYFELMPDNLFNCLENNLGWHLCITSNK